MGGVGGEGTGGGGGGWTRTVGTKWPSVVVIVLGTIVWLFVGVAVGESDVNSNCTGGGVDDNAVVPGVGCDFENNEKCTWTWRKPKGSEDTGFRITSVAQALNQIQQLKGDFSAPVIDANNKTDGKLSFAYATFFCLLHVWFSRTRSRGIIYWCN